MRIVRYLPLLGALPLAGCLLSGQFVVAFDIRDPLDIVSPVAVVPIPVDLTTESVYNDHKDGIANIVDAALVGEIENKGTSAVEIEFWMTPGTTAYATASEVRGDAAAVRIWGPFHLEAGERRAIGWNRSAELFSGRTALIGEIKGDGQFTLYALGPSAAIAYHFTVHRGVLVVTIDAGI
jgi:hypothetical protein